MRVLICGDRYWRNKKVIEKYISELPKDTVIIHGGCRGADILSGIIAAKYGLDVIVFLPEWERYGRPAGPIRNRQMIIEGKPDLIVAFHNDLSKSRGTANMIMLAIDNDIPVKVIKSEWI